MLYRCDYPGCQALGRLIGSDNHASCKTHTEAMSIIIEKRRGKHNHSPMHVADFSDIATRVRYHRAQCSCGQVWTGRVNVISPQPARYGAVTVWDKQARDGRVGRKRSPE